MPTCCRTMESCPRWTHACAEWVLTSAPGGSACAPISSPCRCEWKFPQALVVSANEHEVSITEGNNAASGVKQSGAHFSHFGEHSFSEDVVCSCLIPLARLL